MATTIKYIPIWVVYHAFPGGVLGVFDNEEAAEAFAKENQHLGNDAWVEEFGLRSK